MKAGTARAAALAAALVLATPMARPAAAQRRPAPFETISVLVAAGRNLNHTSFHEQWSPGTAFAAGIEMPFHAGVAEFGVEQLGFRSRTGAAPGFTGRYYFAGWGMELAPVRRLALRPALRIGTWAMAFDDPSLPDARRHESEIALELAPRAAWNLDARWRTSLTAQYRVVLTEPPIHLFNLSAGLSRAFRTPAWLRDVLD